MAIITSTPSNQIRRIAASQGKGNSRGVVTTPLQIYKKLGKIDFNFSFVHRYSKQISAMNHSYIRRRL